MELDDLKGYWKDETNALPQHSPEYIAQLLKGKTADLHTRVKRKYQRILNILLRGMLLQVIVFPFIADGFAYRNSAMGFAKCMVLYCVLLLFYWEKYKYAIQLELLDDIQPRLAQLLQYTRHSLRLEVGLVMVLFTALVALSRFMKSGLAVNNSVWIASGVCLLFVAAMLVLIISKHQRVIRELKTYLAEYCDPVVQ